MPEMHPARGVKEKPQAIPPPEGIRQMNKV